MKISLTDLTVQKLKAGTYFDTKTPAFGIRVGKHRRTWIITKGKERAVLTLGHYPALSLQDARRKALIALGSPLAARTAPPFPEALDAFLAQTHWRASTRYTVEKCLRKHFKFQKTLDRITHEDIAKVIDGLTPGAAGEATKNIRAFFTWCVPRHLAQSPAVGLKPPSYKPRDRVLTDDELRRVWMAAEQMGYPFGTIVKLLILTGQRRSEIGSLKWEYINQESILLPETKNGREHMFPLAALSASLLPPKTAGEFIFSASRSTGSSNGWSKRLKQLQKLSGTSDWTLHDLRRTFATNLAAVNVPIHVTEKLLNHVSGMLGGIAGTYNRWMYWDEQKAALKLWEDKLQSLVRG